MKRDFLEDATRALDESGHEQAGGKFTRERVVATLHDRHRTGRFRRGMLLPLAAVFAGSTAFAAANGSLGVMVQSALEVVGAVAPAPAVEEADPAPPRARKNVAARPRAAPVVAEPEAELDLEAEAEQVEAEASAPTGQQEASAATSLARTPSATVPAVADGHELYRSAHRAHFQRSDFSAALLAYDRYLGQHSGGRFSLDARYNRALCLVRLGRYGEAKAALVPFSQGRFGGYRQQDAVRLLQALEPTAP